VKTDYPLNFYLRIFIVSLLIALLGLAPIPLSVRELQAKAYQSTKDGDYLAASQYLADIAEYYPWRYELNLQAGRYALQAGNPKAAIQYLERPGMAAHLSIDDLILLGDAYHQDGDPNKAEDTWKRSTELGDKIQAYERLANLHLQRKDYASAINEFQKIQNLDPSQINLYYQLGLLYAATDPLKALPFLIQAVGVDPTRASQAQALYDKIRTASLFDDPAYTFLISGRQLANLGEWELASAAFQHAIDLQPGYADAWAFIAEAKQQVAIQEAGAAGDIGISELKRAVQLDPNSTLVNTFMGIYWERQEEYSQAQYYLERAIAQNPTDPYLFSELGNILSKAGDLPAAESRYEEAIRIAPQDPLFYCLLAEFALEQQIQIRELALPAARQALNLDPGNAHALDVMAQVMLMLQDYHSAERFILKALQADPGYVQAYLHLGTVYVYLQEPDLAKQWLNQAKSVGSDTWVASQAQRMLEYYFP